MVRLDKAAGHRSVFEQNKRIILKTQDVCGICGKPVDKTLKSPHPLSPTIDHIIPISKGGHPSDMNNLQLAHRQCNRAKSDKMLAFVAEKKTDVVGNRNLPQSRDWYSYRAPTPSKG